MVVVDRPPVRVAVGRRRRVAARAPHQLEDRAVDRHQQRAVASSPAGEASARRGQDVGEVDARRVDARPPPAAGSSHGACAHSGSQKPPAHAPGRAARGAPRCRPRAAGARRRRWRRAAGRRGWRRRPRRVRASSPRARPPSPSASQRVGRARVVAAGALDLGRQRRLAVGAAALGVQRVRGHAQVAQERSKPLVDPGRLELVGEDRRDRQRQRRGPPGRWSRTSSSGT